MARAEMANGGSLWDRMFRMTERGTTLGREFFAGCTSFLCVSYVLAVNPAILGAAGMDMGAVFTATAVSAIIMTLLLAFYGNVPFAGVSGMGINAFFAYTVVVQMGHSFAFALTAQLIAGLAFLLIAITPMKTMIFDAIPQNIKLAVTAGIGLFITIIGMSSVGIIVSNPGTIVGLGSLHDPNVLIALVGVILIGLTDQAKLTGDDAEKARQRCMTIAAIGTIAGSGFGTSPHIVAVESAAGIAEGGRTGFAALTTGVLFIAALFVAPLLMVIPAAATAPVLIVVGLFMLTAVKGVNFEDISEGIPAFLTIVMMPFAYSIGVGIEWGLVSYVVIKLIAGRHKEISPVMYGLAILFILKEVLV